MKEKIKLLIITNKSDITSDFIVKRLKEKSIAFYRLNTEDIGKNLQVLFDFSKRVYLIIDENRKIEIDLLKIKSVYFRRPEIKIETDLLTKGEVNFIRSELLYTLEGIYKILEKAFWLNNVYDIRNAENKVFQLLLAKEIGMNIPYSLITNNSPQAYQFYAENDKSCIIKPIKCGLIEGDEEEGVIFTNKVDLNESNLSRISVCPIYLQNLVQKKGDVRITVVGDEVFPAFIHSQLIEKTRIDWRKGSLPLRHSPIVLPDDIVKKCLRLTKMLRLNFSAIDFVLDENNDFQFLEINPNGQWAWIERQLEYSIATKIVDILIEKANN